MTDLPEQQHVSAIAPPTNNSAVRIDAAGPDPVHAPEPGIIEVGWLVCDNLDSLDRTAIDLARQRALEFLRKRLPEFQWRMVSETIESRSGALEREPAAFLQWTREYRDLRGWDYVILFVRPDLNARSQPQAWACISRSLDSAVISTARIDPRADDCEASKDERLEAMAHRLKVLTLRSLGHLSGLPAVDESQNVMSDFHDVAELDQGNSLLEDQLREMKENLIEVADLRLEEEQPTHRMPRWAFYVRAGWRNRNEVLHGWLQARPWEMPVRLARLTIAAITTMLVLTMTAEAWELGLRQSLGSILGLSLVCLVATITYVLRRQGLLLHHRDVRLSEQVVTTNITTTAIVSGGIVTTYVCLFVLTLLFSLVFFDANLVRSWAPSVDQQIDWLHYLVFAAFVSSTGIVIGALGASFEGQSYFRHITFVDEEV